MKQSSLKEKQIQKACLDYLRMTNHFCWKNNTVGIFDKRSGTYIPSHNVGSPDIFLVLPPQGRLISIEVKRLGGFQSDNQKDWQKRFEQKGGIYWLICSVDELVKNLKSLQN